MLICIKLLPRFTLASANGETIINCANHVPKKKLTLNNLATKLHRLGYFLVENAKLTLVIILSPTKPAMETL